MCTTSLPTLEEVSLFETCHQKSEASLCPFHFPALHCSLMSRLPLEMPGETSSRRDVPVAHELPSTDKSSTLAYRRIAITVHWEPPASISAAAEDVQKCVSRKFFQLLAGYPALSGRVCRRDDGLVLERPESGASTTKDGVFESGALIIPPDIKYLDGHDPGEEWVWSGSSQEDYERGAVVGGASFFTTKGQRMRKWDSMNGPRGPVVRNGSPRMPWELRLVEYDRVNEVFLKALKDIDHGFIRAGYFVTVDGQDLVKGIAPITLKCSIVGPVIVLGFSFCESIFDPRTMQKVLDAYMDITDGEDQNAPNRDDELFRGCSRIGERCPSRTPSTELISKIFFLSAIMGCYVDQFTLDGLGKLESHIGAVLPGTPDCVASLFWSSIMAARFNNGKVYGFAVVHLKVRVPGQKMEIGAREDDSGYFGKGGDDAMACITIQKLLGLGEDPEPPIDSVLHDKALGAAALSIRRGVMGMEDLIDMASALQQPQATRDRGSCSRPPLGSIDRKGTGLVFEDWTGWEARAPRHIPHTTSTDMCVYECLDDKHEGTLMLLPHQKGSPSRQMRRDQSWEHTQGGFWPVWVCLKQDDMNRLERQLKEGDWLNRVPTTSQQLRLQPEEEEDRVSRAPERSEAR